MTYDIPRYLPSYCIYYPLTLQHLHPSIILRPARHKEPHAHAHAPPSAHADVRTLRRSCRRAHAHAHAIEAQVDAIEGGEGSLAPVGQDRLAHQPHAHALPSRSLTLTARS